MQSFNAAWPATRRRGAQIVRQHWRKSSTSYKFTGKHDEAEDLTQDVFLKIFKSLNTFDRRANFQTWLVSVSWTPYRSLSKRPQRARDDRPRCRRGRTDTGVTDHEPVCRARATRPRRVVEEGDEPAPADASVGGVAARYPGTVVSGNRRAAASAGRHREIPYQSRPHRARAADSAVETRARNWNQRKTLGEGWSGRMNLITENTTGVAIVRVGENRLIPAAGGLFRRHRSTRVRQSQAPAGLLKGHLC